MAAILIRINYLLYSSFKRSWAEKFRVEMFEEAVGVTTSLYSFILAYPEVAKGFCVTRDGPKICR